MSTIRVQSRPGAREKVFGPDHVFVAETLDGPAKVCEQTGRAAEAQELSARAERIRAQTAPDGR